MYAAIVVTKEVAVFSLSHPPTLYNSTVVPNFLCPLHPFHHESEYRPPYQDCPTQKIHSKQVRRSSLLSDRETEMYAGRVACCPW